MRIEAFHPDALDLAGRHGTTWTMSAWDVAAVAGLAITAALYVAGVRRLTRRGLRRRAAETWLFGVGWVAGVIAILPPLDRWAADRFSAHMVQHELLVLVAAPLMVAARPLAATLWGLPGGVRAPAVAALRAPAARAAWRGLTTPLVACALHGVVLWVWHAPALYGRAVENEAVHAVQHVMFVGTAALFWWGLVAGRYGRAGYGAAVLYVFTTAVHTGALGALLTFASVPLYPVYVARTPEPLADQQLAGLLMWVPAGIVLTAAGLGFFVAWLGESGRRGRMEEWG